MDTRTGRLYLSLIDATDAGVPAEHLVEISGPPAAIKDVSAAVAHRAKKNRRKAQHNARRRNR